MRLPAAILGMTITSAVALTSLSAYAADIYRPEPGGGYKDGPIYAPVTSWTGFYAGINGGYGWSANDHQLANTQDPFGGLSPEGGFGGGQIGYNLQRDRFVIGIETDIQGADIRDSARDAAGARFKSELNWFGTVRGRLGYAFDTSLIYFTGGFAYGDVNNRAISPGGDVFKNHDTETGYVLGGGWEYKINPAWSLKAEYQYINLGRNVPFDSSGISYLNTAAGPVGARVEDDAFHTVRIGLNYHLHDDYVPLK